MTSPLHLGLLFAVLIGISTISSRAEQKVALVYGSYEQHENLKSSIRNKDSKALADFNILLRSADEDLKKTPLSVTHKHTTPPSGDKHDYLSLAPYWWPDPAKPDGLPHIRKDGLRNPETKGDHTDVDRKNQFFNRVNNLGLAAFYSEDPRYAKQAVILLDTWFANPKTRMNPHLEYAQGIPGRTDGRCFGIIEWINLDLLITPIQLLRSQDAIPAETDKAITTWFADYLSWLLTSAKGKEEGSRRNNHGTWYDVQVTALLLFLNRPDEAREILEQVKSKRIATQIEPDGRQPHELDRTKSLSYSKMNLEAFTHLADLGDKLGVDLWHYETKDGRSIRNAQTFLAPYLTGNKSWPYQQLDKKDQN